MKFGEKKRRARDIRGRGQNSNAFVCDEAGLNLKRERKDDEERRERKIAH
jgi:hypothetical protein